MCAGPINEVSEINETLLGEGRRYGDLSKVSSTNTGTHPGGCRSAVTHEEHESAVGFI